MIRGTDGLDYQDLTEKLLGNPADTHRNHWLLHFRRLREDARVIQKIIDLPPESSEGDCINAVLGIRLADYTAAVWAGKDHRITGRRADFVIVDELAGP